MSRDTAFWEWSGRFHHRVVRKLMGRHPHRVRNAVWFYTPLEYAMAEVGLKEVETYVSLPQKKIVQFIATRTIMDLCLEVDQKPG